MSTENNAIIKKHLSVIIELFKLLLWKGAFIANKINDIAHLLLSLIDFTLGMENLNLFSSDR